MPEHEDDYFVPSDKLKELRESLRAWKGVGQGFGAAIQFRAVVDTNIVLGDIRWLAAKRRVTTARTELIETVEAGTLDLFVPTELLGEMDEHIERIAHKEGLDHARMKAVWGEYQKKLKVLDPDSSRVQHYRAGVDPDDAVFLALADIVKAVGIISNDRHIAMMGGRRISVDFVLSLRDYSRAAAIELNIKCMGLALGVVGAVAIQGIFEGLKSIGIGIGKAPEWVKLVLIFGVALCVIHPGSRRKINAGLACVLEGMSEVTPTIVSSLANAAVHARKQSDLARIHLDRAMKEIK